MKPRWGAQKTIFACNFERGLKTALGPFAMPWAFLCRLSTKNHIVGGLKQTPWCQGEGTFVEQQAQPSHTRAVQFNTVPVQA
jgi:hypothetical protein